MNRTEDLPKWFSRRKLIVVMASVVGVGLLVVSIVLGRSAIERADDKSALSHTNAVVKSYNGVVESTGAYTAVVTSASSKDGDITKEAEHYKAAYDTYVNDVDTLAKERGIAANDISAPYQKFLDAHKKFVAASSDRAAVMSAIATMSRHCGEQTLGAMDTSDLSKLVEAYDTTFDPCIKGVEQLVSSKNSTAQATGKRAKEYFDSLKAHVTAMQTNYQANNRTQFESEYKTFLSTAESLTSYTDTTEIRTQYNDLLPGKQLTDLATALANKAK